MDETRIAHGQGKATPPPRIARKPRLEWVPVTLMRVSPVAQRDLRAAFVDEMAQSFDPDRIGLPVLSKRDTGEYFIVDGQHRVAAVKAMGWDDQSIQCEVYTGLTEPDEADLFLWLNHRTPVAPFDTFRIGVVAQRDEETEIERMVRAQGLTIQRGGGSGTADGYVRAVGALRKVYRAGGSVLLGRTLRILRDSFGVYHGFLIEGVGLFCARYNGDPQAEEHVVVERLARVPSGVGGLVTKANILRKTTGRPVPHCIAGAVVDIVNSGKGGRKLATWWQ